MITRAITERPAEKRCGNFSRLPTSADISPKNLPSSSRNNRDHRAGIGSGIPLRYFFGFEGCAASLANFCTLSSSFLNPLVKSFVPYSKSTTKQKVKNRKRTSQNSPRSSDMASMVTYWPSEVNEGEWQPNFRLNAGSKLPSFPSHARPFARPQRTIRRLGRAHPGGD